jgi:hypothetical protein
MNSYDERRSMVWSACDCDDPEKMTTSTRTGQDDSQITAEEYAREIGYPFVVGHTLITFDGDENDCEFDEDAKPIFVRLHDVPLWTAEELAQRRDTRLKCLTCSFTGIFRSEREAMVARDVHEFEHGENGNRRPNHPVCVQHRGDGGRWFTLTCNISLDESGEDTTVEFPRPEDYDKTAVDIGG